MCWILTPSIRLELQEGICCMYLVKLLAVASKARNIQQSKLAQLTLLFLGDACGSVIHAPNLVPEVFTVSGPVIFISLPHAAKHITQLWSHTAQSPHDKAEANVLMEGKKKNSRNGYSSIFGLFFSDHTRL